jgi:hypothetical protein
MSKRGPLTPEERQKYIDDGGGSCPYCGDGDYYGDSFECESSTVWQNLTCLACHRTWQDVYNSMFKF